MTICPTPDDAFKAGWDSPCECGVDDPTQCPDCRLTEAEIGRLSVLHRPYLRPREDAPAEHPAA